MTLPITVQSEHTHLDNSPQYTRFATSVAAYGLKLRGDDQLADLSWDRLASIATSARGEDPFGYRSEFVELVRNVAALDIDTETEASR